MLAGAVNLQIEQLELQWSLLVRCVTKSEPKRGQTDRTPEKRDTRRHPRQDEKTLLLPPVLVLVKSEEREGAFRSSKIFTLPELRMRLRQKKRKVWLPPRDSNPDSLLQRQVS